MVKELIHDPFLLGQKSRLATVEDIQIALDLKDTLEANQTTCVGMAANMIGQQVRIIAFYDGLQMQLMLNPVLLKTQISYETKEACLSLLGGPRKTKRYQKIKVQYETLQFQKRIKTYEGFTAQIIQHEIDHCNGILI